MKKSISITIILLSMFIITQLIGLFVINSYFNQNQSSEEKIEIPFFQEQSSTEYNFLEIVLSLLISFIIALAIFFFLIKKNSTNILRAWFFIVVTVSITIVLNLIFKNIPNSIYLSIFLSSMFAYSKVYRRNIIVHNLSELLIYPGISVVFVQYLTPASLIFVLIAISIYDLWAVWKSGIMQKMAKYQLDSLKIFSGFMIPQLSKSQKEMIKKYSKEEKENKKINVRIAILGGGDVVFPIITSGIFLINYGFSSAIFTLVGATLGLSYIFFFGKKEKPYPAMPYITTGIFLGIVLWKLSTILL